MKVRKRVNDLYEDLRDGHNLISLLEVLSGDTLPRERDFLKTLRLVSSTEACAYEQHEDVEDEDKGPREKGRMRFHRLQNVQIALDYLKKRQVKLVNIRNDDITDGNPKLTLGLIWTIILHFQISDIHVTGQSEDMSAKERLLLWTQQTTEGYAGIRCENFTTCWRDGKLFNAIIHKYRPDLIDMNTVAVQSNLANLEHAFYVAEKLGVTRLLDPEDVNVSSPDEKSVITYVSSLYDAFPKVLEGGEGISANDVEVKWVEYQNMVNYLIQWIRHHITIMSDRTFPNNPVELKALYNQYLQFKETEIPPKEIDKSKIKCLYKLLEVWIEFGRVKLPQGYHPNDIEKEWGKLIIAMLEREKTLRPEVERLEMLQQIANRVQRDILGCEDKLILARNALQSDSKRLESGLQFQNEAEIAGYILECENLLRQHVIDAQILIDGKYYQADQLVQRVAKLRDDLLALRTECSSIFSKGHTLTTEQTKLMISGITQSLNSGFAPNLNPDLNSGMTQSLTPTLTSSSLTSGLSSGLTPRLTPAITPAYTPGFPPRVIQTYVTGVDTNALQTLKLMQIRKPLMKSAFVDQNLTEEEVNMKFVQDLLNWVDEMQVQLDRTEWGSDLPSVESHLENHKNVHRAIEDFESSLKEAKISEIQMTAPLKLSYAEKLHKLESQYAKLLNTSRNQERHLDTLHNFVSRATGELIWLNEKEEEEVAYDWSERNSNISRKKEYHADLMRELDQKEEVIKSVQEIAEQLLLENHPARLTIEAYRAAMQTQWSWILQLCHCVEQHLRENAAYFEITIYKDDECVLASNSHRAKWKVISPSGNEAMVPSVCFTVPPPNKEAIDTANRIEQHFQNVLALWHESHINMKSVVSWHYLTNEIETVRAGNVASIKTMLPGEHQQVLSNLQSRFDDFLEDSQDSKVFSGSDIAHLEREVNVCKQYYQELLKSAEREEQEESIYNLYISEVRNIRLRLENCEDRLIRQIRTPLERDDLHESVFRISEQEKLKKELDRLKDDLGMITDKCEEFFSQAAGSPSVPTLRSELSVIIQNMNQVYSMSSIYIEKLKTVNLVLKNTQGAEALVKLYETKLCEEEAVTADKNNIENLIGTLKQWRSEVDEKREVFHALEDELQKAKAISDQMFKTHKERDLDFDWHKEKADQLSERWQNVHSQIENRLRDLEGISKSLKYYKDTYHTLDTWIQKVEDTQRKIQENQPENSKALAKQLNQEKMLVSEIEMKQNKIDECQKYSEQYSASVKDYELQTMTYRAMVDSQQKSPVKRRRMQSSSDFIIQEFMDLRTRYTALVTLMTQYIKFAGDSLKRLEEEEIINNEMASAHAAYSDLMKQQKLTIDENRKLTGKINELEKMLEELKKQKFHVEQELPKVKEAAEDELKKQQKYVEEISFQKTKAEQEAKRYQIELESIAKEKVAAEQELERVRQLTLQAEAQRNIVEENLRAFRTQIEESTAARRKLEEHLRRKDTNLQDLEQQKKALMAELRKKTEGEEKLMKLIKQMEQDFEYQGNLAEKKPQEKEKTEARRPIVEGRYSLIRESVQPSCASVQDKHYRVDSEIIDFRKKQEIKKVEELKQQVDELTIANKKAEKNIKDLKYELNDLELQKVSAEEKARLLKEKLDDANNTLKCLKIELDQKDQIEQGYLQQLKELDRQLHKTTGKAEEVMQEAIDLKKVKINYQEELKSLQQEKVQLKREVEELTRSHTQIEITVQHLNSQINSLQKEKLIAEQRTQSCKGEANNLQDQYKKIQEQLLQKTRAENENQQKIQMVKDDLAKSNHLAESLKQKVEELSRSNTETKIMMQQIQSESERIILEKQSIQRKNDTLKTLADGFKEQLRTTNEQLHKQIIIEQEFISKVKSLEDELIKTKTLASEFKQKCDKQSAFKLNTEIEVKNLNAQLNAFTVEKRLSEQKIQLQQAHIQELNSKLKKLQDEFHQKTLDEQMARKKMALFQEESIRFKHSAEEFRKKVEKLLESHSITENDISGIRLECVTLQQEKNMAEENIKLYKMQIEDLQERLRKCREQLQQGKHAEMDYFQKYQKLEEELEVQRRMVETLKQDMDMPMKEREHQFLRFQNGVKQHHNIKDSVFKLDCEKKVREFNYVGETSPRDLEQLHPCAKMTSSLLRQKQERQADINIPGFKMDRLGEKKLHLGGDDTEPKEAQLQLSRTNQSLEDDTGQQAFTEFVSQTSTQLQITFDKTNSMTKISEIDKLRDKNLHTSWHEEEKHGPGLVKLMHPLEIVKSKQYDVLVEVTTLKQENDQNLGNEDRMFDGYQTSESLRGEDFPKISSFLEGKNMKNVDTVHYEYSAGEDDIKFQGLRHDVTARQLVEVKLLDRSTVEQLHSGQKSFDEVQKSLEMFLTKPTAIAGLYIESSKEIISFALAAKKRIIEKTLALAFLEAQAATGFIIDPTTGQKYSVDDSIVRGLVDNEFKGRLLEAEKAVLGYYCSGKIISVYQAIEARILERQKGKNILEVQVASGGIIDPVRSVRIPPDVAVQLGLLNKTILKFLHEPSSNAKCFQNPNNRQAMYYDELLKICVFDVGSKCVLLPVGDRKITNPSAEKVHKISIVDIKTGTEMTSYEAYQRDLIDKSTYLELLEQEFQWKESTCFDSDGNSSLLLTDLKTGIQFNIEEALTQGTIDRTLVNKYKEGLITANEFGDILLSSSQPCKDLNSPIAGYWLSDTNERITVLKASRKNLVDRITALRCLEAQASTGGIIDPFTGKKYSVSEALQRELIDEISAKQIQQCELVFTGIINPVTNKIMSAIEAMNVNVLNKDTGIRCLQYQYLTGGLIDPKSHCRLSMEDAIKNGIIDAITATKIKDDKSHVKAITCPKTKKKLTYKESLEKSIFDCHTGLRLLEATEPIKIGISSLYYAS
uniref:Calponin-homology (CH) domain-containing protein n=1 Tax=Gopherus agassizii TaxID=38772 RepID=A0A452HQK9_9SAUR